MSAKGWIGFGIAAGVALLVAVALGPLSKVGPPDGKSKSECLDCHRQPNINSNEGVVASRAFCTDCHAKADSQRSFNGQAVSLQVAEDQFKDSPHRYAACIHCHTDVARSPHNTEMGAQCLGCHPVHGEGSAHAPHLRVDCQACHFATEAVQLDDSAHRIRLAQMDDAGVPVSRADHRLADVTTDAACLRCHNSENTVGAPAAVLPAKGLICVVCHPSSASMGHAIYWAGLLVLGLGLFLMVRFWFLGTVQGEASSLHRKLSLSADAVWQAIFSRQLGRILTVSILDIILQRRILKESVGRWAMHSLIFLPILVRFGLSLFTMLLFAVHPEGELTLALIDKNSPWTAFVYDLTGFCILLGIIWAMVQRFVIKPAHVSTEIQDNITLGIVGSLVVLGFLVTAARLLLTGVPADAAIYSFVGHPLSRALATLPLDWRAVYPYLWYAHAVAGLAFIAYLPFGKLKHIFNVPLTYYLEEISGVKKEQRG